MLNIRKIELSPYKDPTHNKLDKGMRTQVAEMNNDSGFERIGSDGYLSPSSISVWMRCPMYFYYDKLDPDKSIRRSNFKMIAGTSGHRAMETIFKNILTGVGIIKDEILSISSDVYTKSLGEGELEEKSTLDSVEFEKKKGEALDNMLASVSAYIENKEYEKVHNVIDTETEFMISIEGIPFYGVVDLLTADKIIDFKFGSAVNAINTRKESIPSDFQLWTYEKAYDTPGALHVIVPPPKTSRAKERELVTEILRSDYATLEDDDFMTLVQGMLTDLNAGRFEKRGLMKSGCGGCQYAQHCLKKR